MWGLPTDDEMEHARRDTVLLSKVQLTQSALRKIESGKASFEASLVFRPFTIHVIGARSINGPRLSKVEAPILRSMPSDVFGPGCHMVAGHIQSVRDDFTGARHWYQGKKLLRVDCGILLDVFEPYDYEDDWGDNIGRDFANLWIAAVGQIRLHLAEFPLYPSYAVQIQRRWGVDLDPASDSLCELSPREELRIAQWARSLTPEESEYADVEVHELSE